MPNADEMRAEVPLVERLAALAWWLEDFPFDSRAVAGAKTVSEAIRKIEELSAERDDPTP